MEPLSVAASIVGLISAAQTLTPMLYNLSAAIKDATHQAQAAVNELSDIKLVLTQLQRYIDGKSQASSERLSLITVEHITATLTGCVVTVSELDAVLKSLHVDQGFQVWDRALWLVKKDKVGVITGRLQNHKSTLGLMLNIIQCSSMFEAEKSMDSLCGVVNKVLQTNLELSMRLRNMEDAYIGRASATQDAANSAGLSSSGAEQEAPDLALDDLGIYTCSGFSDSHLADTIAGLPIAISGDLPKISAFEGQLHHSRVYRHAAGRRSESSLVDDCRSTLAFSISSSITLGEVSKISVYALPVYAVEISNADCYKFGQLSSASPSTSTVPKPVPHIPVLAPSLEDRQAQRRDLAKWWANLKTTTAAYGKGEMRQPRPVFGVPLKESIQYASVKMTLYDENDRPYVYGYLPVVILKCGVYLRRKAISVEHIFSTTGNPKRLQELQFIFDHPPRYGKGLDWTGYTVFDAGSLLVRYLLQLPEPVIPLDFYERFGEPLRGHQAQATGQLATPEMHGETTVYDKSHGDFDVDGKIKTYQSLITEIPLANRLLLGYMLDLPLCSQVRPSRIR